ncbi:MAG: esterase/lipase family protein, partial [Promethearchaeota archaeon]
ISLQRKWAYDGDNALNALQISSKVDEILTQTGASKVDIVAHSMGGLSARYYIKHVMNGDKVDDYVSLDSPQHGFYVYRLWGIDWYTQYTSFLYDFYPNNNLFSDLNGDGNETPGSVHYFCFYIDDISATLDGASNVNTPWVTHAQMPSNAYMIAYVSMCVTNYY